MHPGFVQGVKRGRHGGKVVWGGGVGWRVTKCGCLGALKTSGTSLIRVELKKTKTIRSKLLGGGRR